MELTPCVSVIIVSFHTGPVLFDSITSVLHDPLVTECILVDNGNPDTVLTQLQALKTHNPRLTIITGHGNIGFGAGCNLGALHATAPYLFLLNPDAVLRNDTIATLLQGLETKQDVWASGCTLRDMNGKEQPQGHRNLLSFKTAIGESLGLSRLLPSWRLNNYPVNPAPSTTMVPALSGACLFMKHSTYSHLGGMDEGYFLHVEDLDFCKAVSDQGGKMLYIPSTSITHTGSTSDAPSLLIERYKRDSFIRYFHKHFRNRYGWFGMMCITALITLRYGIKVLQSTALKGRK